MIQKICLLFILFIGIKNVVAQDRHRNLDLFFSSLSQTGQFNGNVLIAENGHVVYEKSFGYADFSNKKNNTAQSSFPIFNILALIVEKISGLSFGSYLQANVFDPAGMTNTSLSKFLKREDKTFPKDIASNIHIPIRYN